jgi:hypothetical protein
MGNGLDEHQRLCRVDVNNQLAEVIEQVKRAGEALSNERAAADEMRAVASAQAEVIAAARRIFEDMMGADDMEEVQEWLRLAETLGKVAR